MDSRNIPRDRRLFERVKREGLVPRICHSTHNFVIGDVFPIDKHG